MRVEQEKERALDKMDTAFWQAMKKRDYAIPSGYASGSLTAHLLAALGDPNPRVREGTNFEVLEAWIHRGVYASDALRAMTAQLLENLTAGLGEAETDTVFLRTFSMLILAEILPEDLERPFLTEAAVRHIMEQGLAYLTAEQDARGYRVGKGWAHALAHTADFLMTLARNRYLVASDLERLLQAIAEKLAETMPCLYLYEEDERLAYAVLTALRRNLLGDARSHSLDDAARPARWHSLAPRHLLTSEQTIRYHNLKTFLRSLYFQLHLTSPAPQIAWELLPLLEKAIRAMDRGYYELP